MRASVVADGIRRERMLTQAQTDAQTASVRSAETDHRQNNHHFVTRTLPALLCVEPVHAERLEASYRILAKPVKGPDVPPAAEAPPAETDAPAREV